MDMRPVERAISEADVYAALAVRPKLDAVLAARDAGNLSEVRRLLAAHFTTREKPVFPAPEFPGIGSGNSMLVLRSVGVDTADGQWAKHVFELQDNDKGVRRTVDFAGPMCWLEVPYGYSCGLYLNQLNMVNALGGLYLRGKEARHALLAGELVQSWVQQVPAWYGYTRDGKVTASGMEVRNRLCNALAAYEVLRRCPELTPEMHLAFWKLFLASSRSLLTYTGVSYPGLIPAAVLLPEFSESEEWLAAGRKDLRQHLLGRTTRDGAWDTHSIAYQTVPVPWAMRCVEFLRANAGKNAELEAFAEEVSEGCARLLGLHLRLTMPNGGLPGIGDVYGRRDWSSHATDGNFRDLAALKLTAEKAAELAELPVVERDARAIDTAFPKHPFAASAAFPATGYYVMRSPQAYVYADFSPQHMGHAHNDASHFEFFAYGKPLLFDTGDYFLGWGYRTALHNAVEVDGQQQSRDAESRMFPCDWLTTPVADFVDGAHSAFHSLGVRQRRKLLFIKPAMLLLVDQLEGKGEHEVEQFFHFAGPDQQSGAEAEVKVVGRALVQTTHKQGANVQIHPLSVGRISFVEAQETEMDRHHQQERAAMLGWAVTSGTFQRVRSATAVFSRAGKLPLQLAQLIVPVPDRGATECRIEKLGIESNGEKVDEQTAFAFQTQTAVEFPQYSGKELEPRLGEDLAKGAAVSATINQGKFSASGGTLVVDGERAENLLGKALCSSPYLPGTPLEGTVELRLPGATVFNTVFLHHGTFNGNSILYVPDEVRLEYELNGEWKEMEIDGRTLLPGSAERLTFAEEVRAEALRIHLLRKGGGRLALREAEIYLVPAAERERIRKMAASRRREESRTLVFLTHKELEICNFGEFSTDGELVVFGRSASGDPERLLLRNASFLRRGTSDVLRLEHSLPWICAEWGKSTLRISAPVSSCGLMVESAGTASLEWNGKKVSSSSLEGNWVCPTVADVAPPVISALRCELQPPQEHLAGAQPAALLTWKTDRPTRAFVEFHRLPDGFRRRAVTGDKLARDHRVRVEFLQPEAEYRFSVKAVDDTGHAASSVCELAK